MSHNKERDTQLLVAAFDFAALKHSTQRRKDVAQTPYINHPIGVAQIISQEGGVTDVRILIAAVLHDTVEDTETTFDEIEERFGKQIRDIVYECSDDKNLGKAERKLMQIEKAPAASYEAKVVKLADKVHNLRDLCQQFPVGWTAERVQEYFEWSAKVVRGLRSTNERLEKILEDMFAARGVTSK